MFLIAGLGNPEVKYAATRHNVGFEAAMFLHERLGFSSERNKFQALISQGKIGGESVVLCRPLTYMNRSGIAIRAASDFYGIEPDNIIVIYDDVALPFGHLRLRKGGSAGGHNGMKNIIEHLGTQDFPRVRIGVGEKPAGWDLADYVLAKFTKEEIPIIRDTVNLASEAAESIVRDGIDKAMNLYNTKKATAAEVE